MPPKVAKADVADSTETAKANRVMDDELKLTWALISQMSAGGKLVGVNWEEVQAQIEAPTKHAAYLRWDALKKRMAKRGFELPKDRAAPEAKAKVTKSKATGVKAPRGKKAKEDAEAAAQAEAQVNGGEISGSGDEEMKDDDAEVKAEVAKPKANGAKKPSGKKAKDTAVQEDDAQVSGGEGAGSVVDEEMKDDAAEVKATKSKPKVTKPKVTKPKVTKSKVTKPKAPRGKKAKELAEAAAASEAATQEEEEKAEVSGGEGAGSGEEVQDHDANSELTSSAPEVAAEEDACA